MASNSIIDDPAITAFDYSLRVSRKARYARLQIKPYIGLEVVIPPQFPKRDVPELVRRHSQWIFQQLRKHRSSLETPELPAEIHFAFDDSVHYPVVDHAKAYLNNLKTLRRWTRDQAWELLPPLLQATSKETGLPFKKITIRSQKTRWGSCSSRGTISLNDQLLFVPQRTARYLMIHELCHTRHMNHSAKFWRLVQGYCLDYRYHEWALNQARGSIPEWYQYSLYRGS